MAQVKKTVKVAPKKKVVTAKKIVKKEKAVKEISAKKASVEGKMPLDKQEVIVMFAQKNGDTGSPEVQGALLTHKIERLTEHLEINKKDNHSRRGLLKVIAKRRRILNYLQKLDEKRYAILIDKLGLKK